MNLPYASDTICAPATAAGRSAVGLIRLSGPAAFAIVASLFRAAKRNFSVETAQSHYQYFGTINDGSSLIDEVLLTLFKAPHSYTGEDVVEIGFHGSLFIKQRLIELLIANGARMAQQGEFTQRAFLNQKMDLSQAEAVIDLIDSESAISHKLALQQMRGGYSEQLSSLRQQLLDFAALIELELDFAEEDVEFANRKKFFELLDTLTLEISRLKSSFQKGNVLKTGIPVAIVGKPNAGKSTLLNALLNEERAIVSDIPGTTRDTIEERIEIEGIQFRFIDTAGLREATDQIESIGIERTYQQIEKAKVVLYLFDKTNNNQHEIATEIAELYKRTDTLNQHLLIIANKCDIEDKFQFTEFIDGVQYIDISAKQSTGVEQLKTELVSLFADSDPANEIIVTNARHYEALVRALEALTNVKDTFEMGLPSDLATTDIRVALYHIGSITGEISSDDVLGTIFSRFCIGK